MDHERKLMMCLVLTVICSSVLGEEWAADVVKSIEALVGSCVVLPCTVSHPGSSLPTSRLRGIWHTKDNKEKFFYHDDSTKILDSFKGRTRLLGKLGQNNCTLEIVEVKDHDNGPFCFRIELVRQDTNQPTKEKFSFVEKCADVIMKHDKPEVKLGPIKTAIQGKPYTLTCSVEHTCPSHRPQIKWSRENEDDEITEGHKFIHSGVWEAESILSFVPEEKDDESELTCTATFNGGIKSEAKFTLNVKRKENYNHIIIPTVAVAATAVIFGLFCFLMVKKYKKRIQELQGQDGRRSIWSQVFASRHQRDCNIEDHFVPLTSQRMEKDSKRILFFLLLAGICSPTTEEQWKASVVKSIEALVDSCVVLPCTFTYPGSFLSSSRLRGIWHHKDNRNEIFYHEDSTSVLDNFKGRTKMLGALGQNNCTLEIVKVKNHDIGPFCFRVEFVQKDTNQPTKEKFSFVEECAEVKMLEDPPQPELIQSNTAVQGKPYAVTCSVRHTCPSHAPVFTWSRGSADDIIQIQKPILSGIWETQSIMVFIPGENDDHTEITCSATFNGGRRSSRSIQLNVKHTGNIHHLIIPVAVAIGTVVIFGVVCIAVMKKYKNRIAELQSREGSMFNRLSRMSRRFHSSGQ